MAQAALMDPESPHEQSLLQQIDAFKERLENQHVNLPLAHHFVWQGIAMDLAIKQESYGAVIELQGHLGYLPYTAENPGARAKALDVIAKLGRGVGEKIQVAGDNTVRLWSRTHVDKDMAIADILTTLTIILMEVQPRLEQLRAHLIAPRTDV